MATVQEAQPTSAMNFGSPPQHGLQMKSQRNGRRRMRDRKAVRAWCWSVVSLKHPCDISALVKPKSIESYFDKVRIWLKQPLSSVELQQLRRACAFLYEKTKRARFSRWGGSFKQCIVLFQPSRAALEFLQGRRGLLINALECSLDWTFEDEESAESAVNLVGQLHVKGWRHRQCAVNYGATRYSGPRNAPNNFVLYGDKKNRNTGAAHCVHLDWRIQRVATLRRMGIRTIADLLKFDHRAFWKKRLLLFDIDRRKLGRAYHNHYLNTRRRGAWVTRHGGITYDKDLRVGSTIVQVLGSTQRVIDDFGRRFPVKRALIEVKCETLLPQAH